MLAQLKKHFPSSLEINTMPIVLDINTTPIDLLQHTKRKQNYTHSSIIHAMSQKNTTTAAEKGPPDASTVTQHIVSPKY